MALLDTRAQIALKVVRTAITTYGWAKRAQGRASAETGSTAGARGLVAGLVSGAAIGMLAGILVAKRLAPSDPAPG
jgi:hypothetical protein